MTLLIVTTVDPVQFIFGIAKILYFQLLFKTTFKTTHFLSGVTRRDGILRSLKLIEPGSSSSEESLSTAAPDP